MKVKSMSHLETDEYSVCATFDRPMVQRMLEERILGEIASAVAARFVAEHFQEICALINPQAIANMSVADAAAQISETLRRKLPDVVREIHHHHTEPGAILQRGIFGGLKRIG